MQEEPSGQALLEPLLGSQHRDRMLVPPIVTVFVPFSLPWLPEMTRQYQELQKQTAAHSQRLEVKVKSLQEPLGMGPRHACPLPVHGEGVCSRAAKCTWGEQGEMGVICPGLSARQQLKTKSDPVPSASPTLVDANCKGDAVIRPLSQSPLPQSPSEEDWAGAVLHTAHTLPCSGHVVPGSCAHMLSVSCLCPCTPQPPGSGRASRPRRLPPRH